jgi:hypothetical protein
MMRFRRGLLWLAAVVLAISLTACGDDDDDDNNGIPPGDAGDVVEDVGDAGDVPDDADQDVGDVTPDAPDAPDASDASDAPDAPDVPDADPGVEPDPAADATITDVIGGTTDVTIEQVAVTYTKPSFGGDSAGFFIQASQDGPALFVSIDSTTTTPPVNAGDIVTFDVVAVDTDAGGRTEITEIANLEVLDTGYDVSNLVQNVTDATDLVSALDTYSQELVTADVEIVGDFEGAGSGFVGAPVDTTGVTGNEDLVLRVPTDLQDELGLINGCTLTVGPSPLWRFFGTAQLSIWDVADASNINCPAASVLEVFATDANTVDVRFSRPIDATSITDASTQFTITPSLSITGASVDGSLVTLTTLDQDGGETYTLTVADTVDDIGGNGVDPANNSGTFFGFVPPAEVVINEVNANISGGCDMVELRVTSGGSLDGFQLWERTVSVASFSAGFTVATNDIIVVHFDQGDSNCNPGGAVSEDADIAQQPVSGFPANYDNAWDWWTQDSGITATNNVLTLYDLAGNIEDAVFLVDTTDCTGYDTAGGTEDQADVVGDAGAWVPLTGTPPAGDVWSNEEFCNAAVPGLDSTTSNANGVTIQRIDDTDDNNRDDWTASPAASSWATINTGQTDF